MQVQTGREFVMDEKMAATVVGNKGIAPELTAKKREP